MNKKYFPIISIVISGILILNEIAWLGKTSLAWVIIALAVANGLNSMYQILTLKGK
jgi:hypothetical protein